MRGAVLLGPQIRTRGEGLPVRLCSRAGGHLYRRVRVHACVGMLGLQGRIRGICLYEENARRRTVLVRVSLGMCKDTRAGMCIGMKCLQTRYLVAMSAATHACGQCVRTHG